MEDREPTGDGPEREAGALVAWCLSCERHFQPLPFERKLPGGGAELYSVCPHCGGYCPFGNISAKGIGLRRKMEQVRQREGLSAHWRDLRDKFVVEMTCPNFS